MVETSDVVLNAVVGFAGLGVTVGRARSTTPPGSCEQGIARRRRAGRAALQASKRGRVIPVDSEHGAIHQCLACGRPEAVSRARAHSKWWALPGRKAAELASVTVAEALAHPTWQMGPKITVDSSTLMNKGLEVIEAHELFLVDYDHIEVVVHPQSIVHSMVEFCDGDDHRPALGTRHAPPHRLRPRLPRAPRPALRLDRLRRTRTARVRAARTSRPSRASRLAFEAGRAGGSAPAWLNAANEVAVAAFLDGRLRWPAIADVVAETLEAHEPSELDDVEDVLEADALARVRAASRRREATELAA